MSVRTMYDAVDVNDVPSSGFDLLAGYTNGHYRSYEPLKQRFPHATVVSIDVLNHAGAGQVLDIEQGDARPDEAPAWFDASLRAGIVRPTLYYSTSNHAVIKQYMGSRKYDAWVAAYGPSHCPVQSDAQVNVVAWQKIDHGPHGENIDISDVFDPYWPHAAPAPQPPASITWTEVPMVKTSYVTVATDAHGNGYADIGAVSPISAEIGVFDPEDHGYPWPAATAGFCGLKNGHHAVVISGVSPNGHIGVYVTVQA